MTSSANLDRLIATVGGRIEAARSRLLIVDFDGTLAEIVDRPEDATLLPEAHRALERIVRRPDFSVAISSGRALADLKARTPIAGAIHSGNHGLEIEGPGVSFVEPIAAALRGDIQSLAAELNQKLARYQDVQVELKGLSISVHLRRANPSIHDAATQIVERTVEYHEGFFVSEGSLIREVRPRVSWNKGKAAAWLRARLGGPETLPIAIGDDTTDEDMFLELHDGVNIRIGSPHLPSNARYRLAGPGEVVAFLGWLDGLPLPPAGADQSPFGSSRNQ